MILPRKKHVLHLMLTDTTTWTFRSMGSLFHVAGIIRDLTIILSYRVVELNRTFTLYCRVAKVRSWFVFLTLLWSRIPTFHNPCQLELTGMDLPSFSCYSSSLKQTKDTTTSPLSSNGLEWLCKNSSFFFFDTLFANTVLSSTVCGTTIKK